MIVSTVRINYTYGETIKLKPIFDVHLGNKYSDKPALKRYLADSDDSTYFIGGGDFLDSIITKDIKRYKKSTDDTIGDAVIDEQVELGYDMLTIRFVDHHLSHSLYISHTLYGLYGTTGLRNTNRYSCIFTIFLPKLDVRAE